jgi:hypothetical protein
MSKKNLLLFAKFKNNIFAAALPGVLALWLQCWQAKRLIFSWTALMCFCSVLSLDSTLPHSAQLTFGIPARAIQPLKGTVSRDGFGF